LHRPDADALLALPADFAGRQQVTVGVQGERVHRGGEVGPRDHLLAGHVPDAHLTGAGLAVLVAHAARRDEVLAVAAERQGEDFPLVSGQRPRGPAEGDVPQADRPVAAGARPT
jgi:hypothetical protein